MQTRARSADGVPIDPTTVMPPVELVLDRATVVTTAAATNTFFAGHFDPDYARRQNRRDVYLATGAVAGLIDRYVFDWLGPTGFLRSRSVRMISSLCAGDTVTLSGEVTSVGMSADPGRGRSTPGAVVLVGLDVFIAGNGERCVKAQVLVELPVLQGSA